MNLKHPKKPFIWISDESWNKLDLKEKDFVIFLKLKRFSEEQICRKLYITSVSWFWRLRKRVENKLKWDIEKFNID